MKPDPQPDLLDRLEPEPKPADLGDRFTLERHVRRHVAWAKKTRVGYESAPKRQRKS